MQSQRHRFFYLKKPHPNPYCESIQLKSDSSICVNCPICCCRLLLCRSSSLEDFSPNWEDGTYLKIRGNAFICFSQLLLCDLPALPAPNKAIPNTWVSLAFFKVMLSTNLKHPPCRFICSLSDTTEVVFYLLFVEIIFIH